MKVYWFTGEILVIRSLRRDARLRAVRKLALQELSKDDQKFHLETGNLFSKAP